MKSFYFCILASFLLFTGCQKEHSDNETLNRIESQLNDQPDSALILIHAIDTTTLIHPLDKAIYHTLRAKAEDKNEEEITDIVGIEKATDYFEQSGLSRYAMLSHFNAGRYYHEKDNLTKGILEYDLAEKIAESLDDDFQLGLCHQFKQLAYEKIHNGSLELYHARKAVEHYSRTDAETHKRYSRLMLCTAMSNNTMYRECIDTANVILFDAAQKGDNYVIASILSLLGSSYHVLNQNDSAIIYLERLFNDYSEYAEAIDYQVYGSAYLELGNMAKAKEIDSEIENTDSYPTWLSYRLAKEEGDNAKALKYLEKIYLDGDEMFKDLVLQTVSTSLEDLHKANEDKLRLKLKESNLTLTCTAVICGLIICILILILRARTNSYRQKEEEHQFMVENMQQSIDALRNQSRKSNSASEDDFKGVNVALTSFGEMCQTYTEFTYVNGRDKRKAQEKVYESLVKTINDFKNDPNFFQRLTHEVNSMTDNMIDRLKEGVNSLSEEDIRLIVFKQLGFTTPVIALFLNTSVKSVYNRKHKIKKLIQESKSPLKESFLALI